MALTIGILLPCGNRSDVLLHVPPNLARHHDKVAVCELGTFTIDSEFVLGQKIRCVQYC